MRSISRREFLGLVGFVGLAGLVGCSGGATGDGASDGAAQDVPQTSRADTGQASSDAAGGESQAKTLVAYFSGTGNTRRVAELAADELSADLFELAPAEPYTAADLNYNDSSSRVVREHDEGVVSVALAAMAPEGGLDAYGRILLGYPIWWHDAAWPVGEFVEQNDFTGKAVVPFCTSASSPVEESGARGLAERAGAGEWRDATRFGSHESEDAIRSWAEGL